MKKLKISIFILGLFILSIFISSTVFAEEVPFEVVKTKVTAETTVPAGPEAIAVNGILYDTSAEGEKFGYPPPEGEFDKRTKIPVEGINYKLEFWNVGKMGGEKGFIFKSNYEKAKLTITYETGQAYKMVENDQEFFGLKGAEKKEVSTPNVDSMSYDLTFTGGPYGKFFYTDKNGKMIMVAYIEDGEYIHFNELPEKRFLIYLEKALIKIDDSSAFEKWMEILNQEPGCADPSDPQTDSGIRFSDYHGEVMIRPCNDEDAWYGAELDMVLHRSDLIKTGDDSSCVLSLADMTTFIMAPESKLILGYAPDKEDKVKLIWGKIKANVKRMLKDGTMDVEMSQAVAGIKGTTFVVEETGTESTLKVIEGHVEFTSKTTGKSEMIGTGEMITATKKGLGKKQEFDIAKENATWESHEAIIKNSKGNSNGFPYLLIIIILAIIAGGYFYFIKQKKSRKHRK